MTYTKQMNRPLDFLFHCPIHAAERPIAHAVCIRVLIKLVGSIVNMHLRKLRKTAQYRRELSPCDTTIQVLEYAAVPVTIPFSTAQITDGALLSPKGDLPLTAGGPESRYSASASIARVIGISGAKVYALVPSRSPFSRIYSILSKMSRGRFC